MAKSASKKGGKSNEMVKQLTCLVSDVYVLAVKAHVYHWNVTGPQFPQIHAYFETQYKGMPEVADQIAERIRMLGSMVDGGMATFLQNTTIKEASTKPMKAAAMIKDYVQDLRKIRNRLAEVEAYADDIEDMVTEDLMVGLMADFDKAIWMLESQV